MRPIPSPSSRSFPKTPFPSIFPQRILSITLSVVWTEVNGETATSLQKTKITQLMEGQFTLAPTVGLYRNPFAPGEVQCGFTKSISGKSVFHTFRWEFSYALMIYRSFNVVVMGEIG